ncbi:nitrate transporter [Diplogelasinospora grovesii]|uniref:Nitrate/nitrite transporter n=1 Tax=Diplogelasinospora grovesii TaxID=303347 RepID=A0AAN6S101_9PEZI|nr:nitrate transporter [Diplogelasinospora grovesii]
MGFKISDMWRAPARSVPILNPFDRHGRVFFFSWMGFMLAFWAWYTFPPLLSVTIKKDLGLSSVEIANSNIVSLTSTLILRFAAGPLCDQFGSRRVFSVILLLGSIPVGLAPLIKDASGLYVIRFFLGLLGATFVPCLVWCTGWFDKNVVGTANALAGGWGNAGGGITYFIMPAVYDSLVHRFGHSPGRAWRITFVVPLVCLVACGLGLLFLCDDTPMGRWDERHQQVRENLASHGISGGSDDEMVTVSGGIADRAALATSASDEEKAGDKSGGRVHAMNDHEADISRTEAMEIAQGETVVKPTMKEAIGVICSPHGLFHVATYACSFGGELAVNSILGAYYLKNFPHLGQTSASNYAAIFGFLNFATRPLGGGWPMCSLLILIGMLDPHNLGTFVGLMILMAVFHEAGNGANFALVPHVYPYANGILSGLTGAGGNTGGVVFAIIFRFMDGGTNYARAFWVIGVIHIALNLAVCWIPPLPKGQLGGR